MKLLIYSVLVDLSDSSIMTYVWCSLWWTALPTDPDLTGTKLGFSHLGTEYLYVVRSLRNVFKTSRRIPDKKKKKKNLPSSHCFTPSLHFLIIFARPTASLIWVIRLFLWLIPRLPPTHNSRCSNLIITILLLHWQSCQPRVCNLCEKSSIQTSRLLVLSQGIEVHTTVWLSLSWKQTGGEF